MDLALVRPLFDRPELPISYPRQIAVQAEAECGTDSYRGPGSDGWRKLEQCWTFLDGFRPDDQTQARCTESGPSLPLLEMRPFLFAEGQKGLAMLPTVATGFEPSRLHPNPISIPILTPFFHFLSQLLRELLRDIVRTYVVCSEEASRLKDMALDNSKCVWVRAIGALSGYSVFRTSPKCSNQPPAFLTGSSENLSWVARGLFPPTLIDDSAQISACLFL
ncbi:hypothetical protein ASPFODRAFT_64603 [Aspergillus luchuensis CBS 106.47]|uniref:Uncharacterized protein n=1 Tax=Aspergillus luchuensis (strain CBS 106.47) TaxID=1137211 RepID=A0A1M3T4Y9_ASPLC|nr:hypothetical protein ASPFODRAFT_64603 [Aspergillus luchuensis CBS 106.47]